MQHLSRRFIFNKLYKDNPSTPFPYRAAHFETAMGSLPAVSSIRAAEAERTFRFAWQRFLVSLHGFAAQPSPIDEWLQRLHAKHQEQVIQLRRYEEAALKPDPAKAKRFLEDTNFYNDDDALLQVTQALRRGENVPQEELDRAYSEEPTSHYAHAVRMGFGYLMSASAYFEGRINQETLKDQLDVGKKGRDGLAV